MTDSLQGVLSSNVWVLPPDPSSQRANSTLSPSQASPFPLLLHFPLLSFLLFSSSPLPLTCSYFYSPSCAFTFPMLALHCCPSLLIHDSTHNVSFLSLTPKSTQAQSTGRCSTPYVLPPNAVARVFFCSDERNALNE